MGLAVAPTLGPWETLTCSCVTLTPCGVLLSCCLGQMGGASAKCVCVGGGWAHTLTQTRVHVVVRQAPVEGGVSPSKDWGYPRGQGLAIRCSCKRSVGQSPGPSGASISIHIRDNGPAALNSSPLSHGRRQKADPIPALSLSRNRLKAGP